MENLQIRDLDVFANGMFPVEISAGKRVNGRHRVPVRASVDVSTGEVRFSVAPEAIKILVDDTKKSRPAQV
ncbi:hypothetical protein [Pengzhenrongella phosphoraccumulans]|uniref:hypothetical protein n=1 Tax=Pengzhenrongella phosphoraccumulans TaxID=3114394 RepID=UPI00388F9B83